MALRLDGCDQPGNVTLQQAHWLHQVHLVALGHDELALLAVPAANCGHVKHIEMSY